MSRVTTYADAARAFDHAPIAGLPGYAALRQALNDLSEQAGQMGITVAELLAAARDMTATTPYGDLCRDCGTLTWPHAVELTHAAELGGPQLDCRYRCGGCGRTWPCRWQAFR